MPIPKNPGEAANGNTVTYLPYMDAYFMEAATRPFIPDELKRIPRFSRILYPDGRVVRFGVPDVIMQPSLRGEINFRSIYTKAGLIWRIQYVRIDRVGRTNYKGELNEGYYLDQRDTKVLRKLPEVSSTSPVDGCIVGTRAEITQKHPHLLLNSYYINLCSGQ